MALAEYDLFKEAEGFLRRFPANRPVLPIFSDGPPRLKPFFAVRSNDREARALLQQGVQEPLIYKILIQRSVDHGYKDNAENLVGEATKNGRTRPRLLRRRY